MIKYGPEKLHQEIANKLNEISDAVWAFRFTVAEAYFIKIN